MACVACRRPDTATEQRDGQTLCVDPYTCRLNWPTDNYPYRRRQSATPGPLYGR